MKKEIGPAAVILVGLFILMVMSGCGALSATTLRCGTDGDSSYVEIVSAPQSVSSSTRAMSELCGFAFDGEEQ